MLTVAGDAGVFGELGAPIDALYQGVYRWNIPLNLSVLLLILRILFFFTLVTGPRRSLSLKMSDTRVYEPQI